jgi:hypothetical protein
MASDQPGAVQNDTALSVKRLADTAEKLLLETRRLRRDIVNLNNRIVPFANTKDIAELDEPLGFGRKNWRAVDALNVIEQARKNILNCEHELSAIRARADAIESDAISREEMKPWIKG